VLGLVTSHLKSSNDPVALIAPHCTSRVGSFHDYSLRAILMELYSQFAILGSIKKCGCVDFSTINDQLGVLLVFFESILQIL